MTRKWRYYDLLLQETRIFDGKTYYFLRRSFFRRAIRFNQRSAERKAEKIRENGDFARVIKGIYRGKPYFRVYFRYSHLKKNNKKKRRKRIY